MLFKHNRPFQQDMPYQPPAPVPAPRGYWYLATPYSKYAGGIDAAFRLACWQTGLLIRAGVAVFSPIAHSHTVALESGLDPLSHDVWLPADRPFMDAARGLILCTAPGWLQSYGMQVEHDVFREAGKPVVLMQPGVVPDGLL